MRENDRPRPAIHEQPERRERRPNASVVRDLLIFVKGHVEIRSNEGAFSPDFVGVEIPHRPLLHCQPSREPMNRSKSTQREA